MYKHHGGRGRSWELKVCWVEACACIRRGKRPLPGTRSIDDESEVATEEGTCGVA
jgi:hypothetical protein